MNVALADTSSPAICPECSVRISEPRSRDATALGLCNECVRHPDARKRAAQRRPRTGWLPSVPAVPREFTPADRAMINRLHGLVPLDQLLGLLNARLLADVGDKVAPYTHEQLHQALKQLAPTKTENWADLRKLIASARREGILDAITPTLIDDFAVVYGLSHAQLLRLKDVVLNARTTNG